MNTTITLGAHLLICGIIITIAVVGFILLNYTNKKENRTNNHTNDMAKYREYSIAKGWVDMLDICRELIARDAQRFEQIGRLFGDLPNMSPEQLEQEFAHMEDLKKALLIRAANSYSEAATLAKTVTRGSKHIARNMADIEQKWPEDVKKYNDHVEQHLMNN